MRFMGAKFPVAASNMGEPSRERTSCRALISRAPVCDGIAALDQAVLDQGVLLDHVASAVLEREFLSKTLLHAMKVRAD